MYKIPLFDLNLGQEEVSAIVNTIRSNWISTGPKCQEFEERFSADLGVEHAVTLANCTCALHLACLVLGVKPGDEVICPSLTFVASVNCIRYMDATPVFCDVCGPEHINIDPRQIERLITKKTKAILVVHMAGFPADMDLIMAVARKHNLLVIEDACHGPLSEYKGRKLGTIGDVGCFSFFSNKNISTGEGGMIVTHDAELAKRVRLLRSHGMTTMSYQRAAGHATAYDVVEVGYNYRMDDLRASIGIAQLHRLKEDLIKRAKVRVAYERLLAGVQQVTIPFSGHADFVSNYIMPIVLRDSTVENRDRIRDVMHSKGVQTSVHYPAVHRFAAYKQYGSDLPQTEYVSDNEITLPMYGKLTEDDVAYVVDSLEAAL